MIKIEHNNIMNQGQTRYTIIKDNTNVGFIILGNPVNDLVSVKGIVINQDMRGKGIAGESYIELNKQLSMVGLLLSSDNIEYMEDNAIKVWNKLTTQGIAVKNTNNYQFI